MNYRNTEICFIKVVDKDQISLLQNQYLVWLDQIWFDVV